MMVRMTRPGGTPRVGSGAPSKARPAPTARPAPAIARQAREKRGRAGVAEKTAKPPRTLRSRVAVALPEESAPGQWLRSIRLSGFTFVMLTVLVLTIVVLAPSLRTFVEQQNQLAALRASVAEHENTVDELNGDIARWDDPAFIEAQARQRLTYVFPGDYSYLVIDDQQTVTTDDGVPISDDIQTTKVDWVHSLLTSIVGAGTTTQTVEQIEAPVQQQ